MPWLTWILFGVKVFFVARRYGPEIAELYRDIMALIHDLRTAGAIPASTEYFHGQAEAELARLQGLKSRDPSKLKDLHAQVSAARERSIK